MNRVHPGPSERIADGWTRWWMLTKQEERPRQVMLSAAKELRSRRTPRRGTTILRCAQH